MLSPKEREFVTQYRSWTTTEQNEYLRTLSKDELLRFYRIPEARLFDKQEIDDDTTRYILFRCGRGFGKSVAGSCFLARKIIDGARSVALYGSTFSDVAKIMVPNMLRWFPPGEAVFNAGTNIILFANGAKCYCLTSERENRGLNLEALWVDELVVHCDGIPEKIRERFDILDMAVRSGKNPQTLITSTPRPFEWFNTFQKRIIARDPSYVMKTGSMWENPFLPQSFVDSMLEKHGNTRLGRQELAGDLLEDLEGALWDRKAVDATRIPSRSREAWLPDLARIVVAVDPSVTDSTSSDETGIVVCGLTSTGKGVVLADYSGRYSPATWAKKVSQAVQEWNATCIVVEVNQGGDLVETNIRTVDRNTRVVKIHAKKGKILRAEPVSALWVQLKAGMNGAEMVQLENQMCTFDGNPKMSSPDRLDAMVYGISELMLSKNYVTRDLRNMPFV